MKMMVEMMKNHIEKWKHSIVSNLDESDFDWINYKSIIPDEGIFYYTPRWPLILHFACAICCFGFSSIYH